MKKKNPIAVKKLIELLKVFCEKFFVNFLMPSTLFSLNFFLEIAVFVCFCSLCSRRLMTSLLGL